MPIRSTAVSVATTATLLADEAGAGSVSAPVGVYVANVGSATIYVGGDDVTTSTGYPVAGTSTEQFYLFSGDKLYGVVSASTVSARVLKQRA